jgi:hypothetical protein
MTQCVFSEEHRAARLELARARVRYYCNHTRENYRLFQAAAKAYRDVNRGQLG